MGLFRPYDQDAKQASGATAVADDTMTRTPAGAPKNRPTPTRKEAEAARMAALHPRVTRREAKALDRAADNKRKAQQLDAMDNQPERVLLRNYIDSRWSMTEFMWPLLLILLAGSLLGGKWPVLVVGVTLLLYALVLVTIINFWFSWHGFRKELTQRYPGASTKGLLMAMISRMSMIRRVRTPAPAIARGATY